MKLSRFTHLHTIVALGIFAVLCATLFFPLPAFGFLGDVGKEIGVFILQMIGLLTWLGGVIMNFAVERLVVGMGAQISGGGFGISIELAWIVVRDLMNIFFVFGLVFVGMALILNIQKYDLKKQLAFIIIGALLVNFSLFFAKFVIDVANVTATEIYEELIFAEDPLQKRVDVGISGQFMGAMGLVGLFDEGTSQIRGDAFTGSLSFMIAGAFFLLVAAFVFAAAGILIIIRFIVLVFLMIFSPIAFGALAFPQTQKYALQWWKMLFSQAFFAPALLFLLYISLQVLNGTIGANTNSASFAEALSGSEIDIILAFFLATGFLIGSLIIAKQMGSYGAQASINVGNAIRGRAQSFAGRNTIGRASDFALKGYESLDAKTANSKTRRWANRALSLTTLGAWDAVAGERGIRNTLTAGKEAKFGGPYSRKDDKEYGKERKKRRSNLQRVQEMERSVSEALKGSGSLDDMEKKIQQATASELEDLGTKVLESTEVAFRLTDNQMENILKSDKFTETEKSNIVDARRKGIVDNLTSGGTSLTPEAVGKASGAQLETLGTDNLVANAEGLTSSQLDDIKKSKKFTESEFGRIKDAQKNELLNRTGTGGTANTTEIQRVLEDRKEKERAKLPEEILTHPDAAPKLTGKTLKSILNDSDMSAGARAIIRSNITAAGTAADPSARNFLRSTEGGSF